MRKIKFFSLKKDYLAQHLATFFLGFTGIIGSVVNQHSFVIVFFRTFFAFCSIFLLFNKKNRKKIFQFTIRDHLVFLLTASILVSHWFTFFIGIQKSSASIGTLAFSIFPLFLTLLEPIFFSMKYSFYKSVICVFLLLGVFLLPPSISFNNEIFVGVCWGILSGFFMALFILYNRFLSSKFPAKEISFFQNFYGAILSLPFALIFFPWNISAIDLVLLFCLGVICTGFAHVLSIFSLKTISAQISGIINSLESIYTVIFSFLLLGERLSPKSYVGVLIIIISFVAFSQQKEQAKKY